MTSTTNLWHTELLWRSNPNFLRAVYGHEALSAEEIDLANRLISEWLLGPDEALRYTMMLLVDEHKIAAAAAALNQLAWQLEVIPTEEALKRLRRVQRSIARLGSAGQVPRPRETPLQTLRREWANHWQLVHDETDSRDYQDNILQAKRMGAPYYKFDVEERRLADEILSEWLLSDDDSVRSITRWVVEDCRIVAVLPALHKLEQRLAAVATPAARSDRERVQRVIAELSAPPATDGLTKP